MALEEYQRKRDFTKTPEPPGAPVSRPEGRSFVVHKHASRRLHYDLRLEIGGAYASWAVPKGPSLDPKEKHLAVHVEDHPIEYGSFEGTIPEGEYGAGTVMIWDRGSFTPVGDAVAAVAKGHVKFSLDGEKLKGLWALVRMKPRGNERQESWLLMKERDEEARPHESFDLVAEMTLSAASGRTMEEIASSDARWTSEGPSVAEPKEESGISAQVPPSSPMPTDAPLQLATLVDKTPDGPAWIHEVKYDGYRLRVAMSDGRSTITTRSGADWTDRFPTIANAAARLPVSSALLDGEAVVLDERGLSDFGRLQEALGGNRKGDVTFAAFDVLYLNGHDLRTESLVRRKSLLESLLDTASGDSVIRYTTHQEGGGPAFHRDACEKGLEGSISKRGDRPWVPGRSMDWRKVKCLARQEFVIAGWTEPGGSREGFGALLLGVYDEAGSFIHAGRVGTGFDARTLVSLKERLDALTTDTQPFSDHLRLKDAHWVEPQLVAEVAFREWTREGVLRQPSFLGIREDTDPRLVRREKPLPAPENGDRPAPDPEPVTAEPRSARRDDGELVVAGIRISNPDKRLDPAGVTKEALARYYEAVAEHILPHVDRRPLTLVRCPRSPGTVSDCFYQKHPEGAGWPKALRSVTIMDREGPEEYSYVVDAPGLLSLVQLGVLEIHVWNSLADDPERPDRIVLDLDPGPGVAFEEVTAGAVAVRDALRALGLDAFAKTTGGKGIHVVTPLVPGYPYEQVRAFARGLVDVLAAQRPDSFTARMAKAERPGRVFIDYLRNAHGATAVCAYSTRARPGGGVSVPVSWEELEAGLDPAAFDMETVPRRLLEAKGDPWAGYEASRRPLEPPQFTALGLSAP